LRQEEEERITKKRNKRAEKEKEALSFLATKSKRA
jgi:hypothetical protein